MISNCSILRVFDSQRTSVIEIAQSSTLNDRTIFARTQNLNPTIVLAKAVKSHVITNAVGPRSDFDGFSVVVFIPMDLRL
jgi:hypothetical protein